MLPKPGIALIREPSACNLPTTNPGNALERMDSCAGLVTVAGVGGGVKVGDGDGDDEGVDVCDDDDDGEGEEVFGEIPVWGGVTGCPEIPDGRVKLDVFVSLFSSQAEKIAQKTQASTRTANNRKRKDVCCLIINAR